MGKFSLLRLGLLFLRGSVRENALYIYRHRKCGAGRKFSRHWVEAAFEDPDRDTAT